MADVNALHTETPWREVRSTAADWREADGAGLVRTLHHLQLIRAFEETRALARQREPRARARPFVDRPGGRRRRLHRRVAPGRSDQRHAPRPPPFSRQSALPRRAGRLRCAARRSAAADAGRSPAHAGGDHGSGTGLVRRPAGGSMHLRWREAGVVGTNAIVGGGVPIATGVAWSRKRAGNGDVVVTFSATARSIRVRWPNPSISPRCTICRSCSSSTTTSTRSLTTIAESTRETRLSARGLAYGIPAFTCDGMDPLAVRLATDMALATVRAGEGPAIVEAHSYRYFHQNGPLPGSAFGYRDKAEEAAWRARDPLDRMATELAALGHLDDEGAARLRGRRRRRWSVPPARFSNPRATAAASARPCGPHRPTSTTAFAAISRSSTACATRR